MSLLRVLTTISGVAFLAYGAQIMFTLSMEMEFTRYGLKSLRMPIATLEILAGLSLLGGLVWIPALWISSGGLFLLMLAAVGLRIRIGDGFLRCLPATAFMLLNLYILIASCRKAGGF